MVAATNAGSITPACNVRLTCVEAFGRRVIREKFSRATSEGRYKLDVGVGKDLGVLEVLVLGCGGR